MENSQALTEEKSTAEEAMAELVAADRAKFIIIIIIIICFMVVTWRHVGLEIKSGAACNSMPALPAATSSSFCVFLYLIELALNGHGCQ